MEKQKVFKIHDFWFLVIWWNEEVKAAIKIKRDSYRDLKKNCDGVSFERYKLAKKETKKAVQNARVKVYKEVWEVGYQRGWKWYIELLE